MANAKRDRQDDTRASGLRRKVSVQKPRETAKQLLERIQQLEEINGDLIRTEERFRLLAENAYDVVYRYQLGTQAGFDYISPSIVAMTGYTPEALYEDPRLAMGFVVPPEGAQHGELAAGDQALGDPKTIEFVRADGITRWIEIRRSGAYDEDGELAAIEGIARDITERYQAERALEAAYADLDRRVKERTENLAQANETLVAEIARRKRVENELRQAQRLEAVGTVASGIAHDFNNSLQSIIGCSDLALARLEAQHPSATYIYHLRDTAVNAAGVVDQLMQFGQQRDSKSRTFDLNRLLAARDTLLRRLLGEDIQLRVGLGPSAAPVHCDPTQIEQVLMNLVINARHAMPRGGHLTIETTEQYLDPTQVETRATLAPGRHIVLTVKDTGHGMTDEVRQRVFEPFFTTKPPEQGTGLGLATAYGIVTGADGHIEVESEPGQGSTFTLYLPVAEQPLQSDITELSIGGQRGNERVLVVEDEPLVRLTIRHYLERHGYKVLDAADLDAAREILTDCPDSIDVLLTDIVLPSGEGSALVPAALEQRPNLRVVYMSGHAADTVLAERQLDPGTRVLQKPFTERQLALRVREALGQSSHSLHPPASDSITLLLVEDDALARMACSELLRGEGYQVVAASDRQTALEHWRDQQAQIDLVISDLGLADGSGLELVDELRRAAPELPVVLLSGRPTHDAAVQGALRLPGVVYLQKPIEIGGLVGQIRQLLEP